MLCSIKTHLSLKSYEEDCITHSCSHRATGKYEEKPQTAEIKWMPASWPKGLGRMLWCLCFGFLLAAILADVWHQKNQNPGRVVEPGWNRQAADIMAEWQHSTEAKCSIVIHHRHVSGSRKVQGNLKNGATSLSVCIIYVSVTQSKTGGSLHYATIKNSLSAWNLFSPLSSFKSHGG